MAEITKNLVNIYLIDEQRTYLTEIKERFQNPLKYRVNSYTSLSKFLEVINTLPHPGGNLHIVCISVDFKNDETDTKELRDFIYHIKKVTNGAEVFILSFKKDDDTDRKVMNMGARALIQKNENAVLRITNFVKGIISEKNLEKKRKASLLSIKVLAFFILAIALLTVILYITSPNLFIF